MTADGSGSFLPLGNDLFLTVADGAIDRPLIMWSGYDE